MTDPALRKICPKSGERCDCPKGKCEQQVRWLNIADSKETWQEPIVIPDRPMDGTELLPLAKAIFECPECKSKGFEPSELPKRCTFCDGTYSGNLPTREEIYDAQTPEEQSRMDRQEAGSLKYAYCTQILLLSSGKFALFGRYKMGENAGIPLIAIDTWANLEAHAHAYRKTAEEGYQQEKMNEEQRRSATAAAADYESLFGEES